MAIFKRKSKLKFEDGKEFPMLPSDDLEPDEGGIGPFVGELSQYRFTHQQESINLAKAGQNPDAWNDGRLLFDLETGLAHLHQGLRDRLQVYVRNEIREATEDLYEEVGALASAQVELLAVDRDLERLIAIDDEASAELRDEPQEITRLSNLRSQTARFGKFTIALLFVLSEFIITGFIFNQALPLDIPYIGYVLAVGVIVMLIAVPHYLAQGLKEGMTLHHRFDLDGNVLRKGLERTRKQRQAHREEKDDKGFLITSFALGGVLLLLVIPLSILRASDTLQGNKFAWFSTFLLIQFAVSGYFFLREWLDHGAPSSNLHRIEKHRFQLQKKRIREFENYTQVLSDCIIAAQPIFKILQDFIRMDSLIVETYYSTIHFGRHLQEIERPELSAFINGSRIPYLGPQSEIDDERGTLYDSTTASTRALEARNTRSREWLFDQAEEILKNVVHKSTFENAEGNVVVRPLSGGLIDSPERDWIYGYLEENFGLKRYVTPSFEAREEEYE